MDNENHCTSIKQAKLTFHRSERQKTKKREKKSELENVLHEKAEIIWSKFSKFSNFYNAVIRSIIMFVSVCWGGNISKLDRGRLEKIVKKQIMLWESHWTVLRLYTKRDCTEN